jgi:hypothetical protein
MREYTSVESVFNEAVIEDIEEEAEDAAGYGDIIDDMAGLSEINDCLRNVDDGVLPDMIPVIIGDDEVMQSIYDKMDTGELDFDYMTRGDEEDEEDE